jgi:hypothetical protein
MDTRERIEELRAQAAEHRANIARRQAEREADPGKMQDYLMGEETTSSREEVRTKKSSDAGLVFKQRDDALVAATTDAENQAGWDLWLRRHLDNERAEIFEAVAREMAEFACEYVCEKLAPLKTEIADLRRALQEREERAAAIAEVKKQYAGERVEHEALQLAAALAVRDAKIEKLEAQLGMLLRFLNVSGFDLPRGT